MNHTHPANLGSALPAPDDPLPELDGTHGMRLLRQFVRDSVPGQRMPDPEQRKALAEVLARLEAAMEPAGPEEIARQLEALMWHYPRIARPPEAEASVARDWIRDLGHLPPDIVDAACTGWRRGVHAYAPMPGHLLAIADPILAARRMLLTVARRLAAPEGSGKGMGGRR